MSLGSRHTVSPPVPAGERYQIDLDRSDIVDLSLPAIKLDAHTLRLVGAIAAARANHRACVSNRDFVMSLGSRHTVAPPVPACERDQTKLRRSEVIDLSLPTIKLDAHTTSLVDALSVARANHRACISNCDFTTSDASRHAVAPPVPTCERYQIKLRRSDVVDLSLPTIKLDAHTLRLVGPIVAARANHRACVSNRDFVMSDASRHAVAPPVPACERDQTKLRRSEVVDLSLPTVKLDTNTLCMLVTLIAARANHRACISNRDLTISDGSRHTVTPPVPTCERYQIDLA